jgi:hypothetical protein
MDYLKPLETLVDLAGCSADDAGCIGIGNSPAAIFLGFTLAKLVLIERGVRPYVRSYLVRLTKAGAKP